MAEKKKSAEQIKNDSKVIGENRKSVSDAVIKLAKICASLENYKFELHEEINPIR